ncbi:hypothetical protein B0H10DRAFT_2218525 [Mycena sp. CBHHK59/15]|nr:hypothetical protein B0H10DRAFT_2218525 [Mycena sp. CBHHK59/15]
MWQYNSNDWQVGTGGMTAATVAANYNALIAGVGSGTFDGHIVPIAVVQNKTQPYLETNFSMPMFQQYISSTKKTNASASSSTTGRGAEATDSSGVRPTSVLPTVSLAALGALFALVAVVA